MSDQSPSCPDVHVELTKPVAPSKWLTRKWVDRRRRFGSVTLGVLSILLVAYELAAGSVFRGLIAAVLLPMVMVWGQFEARHFVFCPACDILLGRWRRPFRYSFCDNCGRLVFPDRIRSTFPKPLELQMVVNDSEPIVKLIGLCLVLSVRDRATKVLFEPTATEYKVQMLADGKTYDLVPPPLPLHEGIADALKLFADMEVRCSDRAQQGRMQLRFQHAIIEAMVESQPQDFGEKMTITFDEHDVSPDDVSQFLNSWAEKTLVESGLLGADHNGADPPTTPQPHHKQTASLPSTDSAPE